MPVTDARLRANRQNAQRSTGPRTAEGKAVSSQNARTHGLTAQTLPLLGADRRRFNKMADKFRAYYNPEDAIEEDIVDRLIMARCHLSNAERLLSGYFDILACSQFREPKRPTERSINRKLAQGFMDDVGKNAFTKIMRYKQDAQRTADRLHVVLEDYRVRAALWVTATNPRRKPVESPETTDSTPLFKPDLTPPRGNDTPPEPKRWPFAEADQSVLPPRRPPAAPPEGGQKSA
jgi:hypothetical protein